MPTADPELAPTAPSPARRWGKRLLVLAVFAGSAYLVHRLVGEVGWREVWERLRAARRPAVAAAIGSIVAQFLVWGYRFWLPVRRIDPSPGRGVVLLTVFASAAANHLLPAARVVGGVLRARYLSRASAAATRKRVFFGTVLFDQVIHFGVMGGLTVAGLVVGAALLGRTTLALTLSLAVVAVTATAVLLGRRWLRSRAPAPTPTGSRRHPPRHPPRPGPGGGALSSRAGGEGSGGLGGGGEVGDADKPGGNRLQRFVSGGQPTLEVFGRLARDGRLWRRATALGLVLFAFATAAQWWTFYALGTTVDPLRVAITLSVALSAGVLLGTPGGLGTVEATMIALYGAFGLGRVEAASAVLLYRGLHYAVLLALGLPALGYLELALRPGGESRAGADDGADDGEDPARSDLPDDGPGR